MILKKSRGRRDQKDSKLHQIYPQYIPINPKYLKVDPDCSKTHKKFVDLEFYACSWVWKERNDLGSLDEIKWVCEMLCVTFRV